MAVAVAHFTANQLDSTGTTLDTTITSTTAGNGGVLAVFWKGATTITSVTEGIAGSAFSDSGAGKLDRPTDGHIQIFGRVSLTSAITTVRTNFSGSSTACEAYWWEVSGQSTGTLFTTQVGTKTGTSGVSITTSSFTPSNSGKIISLACTDAVGTVSGDTGYTVEYNPSGQGICAQDKSFTSGAQTTTATYANAMTKGAIMSVCAQQTIPSTSVGWGRLLTGERNMIATSLFMGFPEEDQILT
jgi:hypothetical protein